MRVWLDQGACLNSGLCEENGPQVFVIGDDDVASVRAAGGRAGGSEAEAVTVPAAAEEDVLRSARECPAQCIHVLDER